MIDSTLDGVIIVIDDEPRFVHRIIELLGQQYEIHPAYNGNDGLALVEKLHTQKVLIICDVNLLGMTGFEVCRKIKAFKQSLYVMLLTTYNDAQSRLQGLQSYADNYVDKACEDDELRLIVRNTFNTIYPQHTLEPANDTSTRLRPDNIEQLTKAVIDAYYKTAIHERPQNGCNSTTMAQRLNKSHRTFQREIKHATGQTFQQYHLLARLQKSRDLLARDITITQIAELLEFSSPAHLSRAFKEEYEITPSKYRQTLKHLSSNKKG